MTKKLAARQMSTKHYSTNGAVQGGRAAGTTVHTLAAGGSDRSQWGRMLICRACEYHYHFND